MPTRKADTEPAPAAPDATDAAAGRVLQQFRQIFNAVKTHFQQVERAVGIGGASVWALSVVQARPGVGIGELARAMNIHPSTASNLVKALVERELMVAERQGSDRRAVQLKLSPTGRRLLKRSPGPFAGVLPDALASLDLPALQRLEADLASLLGILKTDERAAHTPLADL